MDYYEEMLKDEEPLASTMQWLFGQGKLLGELTLYQQDYNAHPLSGERVTGIRCICSECQTTYYTAKTMAGTCRAEYAPAPFGLWMDGHAYISGDTYECPYCGALTKLYYSGRLGTYDDAYIEGLNVVEVRKIEGYLCILEWHLVKKCSKRGGSYIQKQPYNAYVLDEKRLIRLTGMSNNMGYGYRRFAHFQRRQGYMDMIGRTSLIAPFDAECLIGTDAENSKLDIYICEALKRYGECMPVSYLRAWLSKPRIENLLSCGAGRLFTDIFHENYRTASEYAGTCKRILKLEALDLKKVRPSEMLGLNTEEFRMALDRGWGVKEVRAYRRLKETGEPFNVQEDLPLMLNHGNSEVQEMKEYGLRIVKTIRYLGRQGEKWCTLKDYYQMAQRLQMPLDRQILRYPKNLRRSHDDLMRRQKLKAQTQKIEAFAASSARYDALQWTDKELCMILPQTQEELIAEGNVLQHCVGGYADSHINGKIILFVRHYRRPERSFYTLNVDMTGERPRRIQLHGYGNERHGKNMEHRHSIPKKVLEFVDRWEKEVLLPQWSKLKKKGA